MLAFTLETSTLSARARAIVSTTHLTHDVLALVRSGHASCCVRRRHGAGQADVQSEVDADGGHIADQLPDGKEQSHDDVGARREPASTPSKYQGIVFLGFGVFGRLLTLSDSCSVRLDG